MKKFSRFYVKYLIKSSVIFYVFLAIGVALFLYLSLHIKLDVITTYDAQILENNVIINCDCESSSDVLYLYNDRNEDIYKLQIESITCNKDKTIFTINDSINLVGDVKAEVVTGKQTLLHKIFVKAGKK